ncbi:CBS domain-containing protein [Conexibacter woesei]|uniref:CBS domain containing membrane protein n=1 Tax=Conexibacter woesei (strain DSM 14684 / CCUG 47730 / CIP 108061 / JCM 11494 / NBRC 100937 / ID131577) TaxID=469383 RepID=D3F8S8_CONWI|nr:CBS domain-containing protein [Conexibacter woesei]ADB51042.1 CBS domain containing membrane protein [Conexibacter woesei DSM 14684]
MGILRHVPVLRADRLVREAVHALQQAGVPALPVEDEHGRFLGIFGEREFIEAIFPGYIKELRYAGFVPHSLDVAIERRSGCLDRPVGEYATREQIAVSEGFSDAELAETFLHHRVLIVPVVDGGRRVIGIVTRTDFFEIVAGRVEQA